MGSSPLTRGKLDRRGCLKALAGLIPAHAGKTRAWPTASRRCWAHPRSRGENRHRRHELLDIRGSSPLTRGKRVYGGDALDRLGLIPAHAGKTRGHCWFTFSSRAHPRSRGENRSVRQGAGALRGSSPLTRGKRVVDLSSELSDRLIPAHAGKTGSRSTCAVFTPAHPRSRGENGWVDLERIADSGSSPLTRGKHESVNERSDDERLIPAHAGKTSYKACASETAAAHPRSRGEN